MAQDYTDRFNNLQFLPFINNKCFIGYKRHQLEEYRLYEMACSCLPYYDRIIEQFHPLYNICCLLYNPI